jgi:hypothetical protein
MNACVDVLVFGLQELMAAPPPTKKYRPHQPDHDGDERIANLSRTKVIDIIRALCSEIGRPMPEWGVERRPGIVTVRRCIDCGTELTAGEKERCPICEENSFKNYKKQELEAARAERAENRDAMRTAKVMVKIISRIQKRRRGLDDARHRGHSGEDAGAVDAGGCGQDQRS